MKFFFVFFAELRVFQEWIRNRFGVFPETGFAEDDKFPQYFEDENGHWKMNQGCQDLVDSAENVVSTVFRLS